MKKIFKFFCILCLGIIVLTALFLYFHNKHTLIIQTPTGDVKYRIERAVTREEQQKGLMYRKHLPQNHGMIFIFNPPRVANMWMRNTLIPLDMVFFDHTGRVISVHKNAIPHDETIISSFIPVAGVLEINAGEAQKFRIGRGTTLNLDSVK